MYALQLNLLINILFERISIVAFKGRRQRYVQIYYLMFEYNLLTISYASERETQGKVFCFSGWLFTKIKFNKPIRTKALTFK